MTAAQEHVLKAKGDETAGFSCYRVLFCNIISDVLNHTHITMTQQRIRHKQTEMEKIDIFFLYVVDSRFLNQNHKLLLTRI